MHFFRLQANFHSLEHLDELFDAQISGGIVVHFSENLPEVSPLDLIKRLLQLIIECFFGHDGIVHNDCDPLLDALLSLIHLILAHLVLIVLKNADEALQVDVAGLVLVEVVDERLDVLVTELIMVELLKEVFEVVTSDVALHFFVNELKEIRITEVL